MKRLLAIIAALVIPLAGATAFAAPVVQASAAAQHTPDTGAGKLGRTVHSTKMFWTIASNASGQTLYIHTTVSGDTQAVDLINDNACGGSNKVTQTCPFLSGPHGCLGGTIFTGSIGSYGMIGQTNGVVETGTLGAAGAEIVHCANSVLGDASAYLFVYATNKNGQTECVSDAGSNGDKLKVSSTCAKYALS